MPDALSYSNIKVPFSGFGVFKFWKGVVINNLEAFEYQWSPYVWLKDR